MVSKGDGMTHPMRASEGEKKMPGQATVVINGKEWSVGVANTYSEVATGLSGISSIPSGSGVLFDLGVDQSYIQIDMSRMLFPLDIIFINSTKGVVGVCRNVQPQLNVRFENYTLPGARCFLEVNAGETEGIEVGDDVSIQGTILSPLSQTIVAAGVTIPVAAGVAAALRGAVGAKKPAPKDAGKWKLR